MILFLVFGSFEWSAGNKTEAADIFGVLLRHCRMYRVRIFVRSTYKYKDVYCVCVFFFFTYCASSCVLFNFHAGEDKCEPKLNSHIWSVSCHKWAFYVGWKKWDFRRKVRAAEWRKLFAWLWLNNFHSYFVGKCSNVVLLYGCVRCHSWYVVKRFGKCTLECEVT